MPPPWFVAELPEITLVDMVAPALRIAAPPPKLPAPAAPWVKRTPDRVTAIGVVEAVEILKTREARLPLIVSLSAPGPTMYIGSLIAISPCVRVIVLPLSTGSNWTMLLAEPL